MIKARPNLDVGQGSIEGHPPELQVLERLHPAGKQTPYPRLLTSSIRRMQKAKKFLVAERCNGSGAMKPVSASDIVKAP